MAKAANKPSAKSASRSSETLVQPKMADRTTTRPITKETDPRSKQSRVVAVLSSPGGATIAAMMKETGWQQHSVRGFLAGVVRKKLKLRLFSEKISGQRVYRIDQGGKAKTAGKRPKRRAA